MPTAQDDQKRLLKTRISKNVYSFDVSKRFSHSKRYKAVSTQQLNLETIRLIARTFLLNIFRPSEARSVDRDTQLRASSAFRSFGKNLLVIFFLFILVISLGVAAIFYTLSQEKPPLKAPPLQANPSATLTLLDHGVACYGEGQDYLAYSSVQVSGRDIGNATIYMDLFADPIPQKVYILKSRREQASSYPEFKNYFEANLDKLGMHATELHLEQLKRLPPNEPAILLVPSGFMPESFLGLDNDGFNLNTLLNRQFVVFYIGFDYTRGVMSEDEGRVSNVDVANAQNLLSINFFPPRPTEVPFTLRNPEYWAAPIYMDNVSSFGGSAYGSVSIVARNSGYIVFLPQTLDAGWALPKDAADNIFLLLRETIWQKAISRKFIASGVKFFDFSSNVSRSMDWIFSSRYPRINATSKIRLEAVGINDERIGQTISLSFPVSYNGELRNQPSVLPGFISGQLLRAVIDFNEDPDSWKTREPINAYLESHNATAITSKVLIRQDRFKPERGYRLNFDYEVTQPPGDYTLRVVDENGNGYAQSFLHVQSIDIKPEVINMGAGYFTFIPYADGKPGVILRDVKLRIDNGSFVTLDAKDPDKIVKDPSTLEYRLFKGLSEGNHTFELSVAGKSITFSQIYRTPKNWWDNPLYWGLLLVTAVLFIVGILIKRPDIIYYSLDIPDFPPRVKNLIPVSKSQVLGLFNTLNKDYGWKHMPLKAPELKNGFRKMTYMGRTIVIGDYNLERLLDELSASGDVVKLNNLYSLRSWAEESGMSIRHLTVFRLLRDICVNNAVPFTDLGKTKECDLVITTTKKIQIHIYDGDAMLSRLLESCAICPCALVFAKYSELELFRKKMNASSPQMALLKMLEDSKRLVLVSVEDFEQVVIKKYAKS